MAEPRFDDEALRRYLLSALSQLTDVDHLEVLHAIDDGDVEIVLTDRRHVHVVVQGRYDFRVPVGEVLVNE